jgi:benzodiazapine receptor
MSGTDSVLFLYLLYVNWNVAMNKKVLAILNSVALLATVSVNALANALPFNGMTTGQVSTLYPNLFTPVGSTFSIWTVIYFLLAGFIVLQWTNLHRPFFVKVSVLFIGSCILNICWMLAWHYLQIMLSVAIMVLLLIVLIRIFLILQKHTDQSIAERSVVHLPFTIYTAWISVSTIANISAYLASLNWNGGFISEIGWTIIMMGGASALGIVVIIKFHRYAFALVIAWALTGIAMRNYPFITPMAIVLVFILLGTALYTYYSSKKNLFQGSTLTNKI